MSATTQEKNTIFQSNSISSSASKSVFAAELPLLKSNQEGLNIWLTAIFVAGGMAGSGILALPHAFADAGWSGIALLTVCCLNSLYSGICLGRCWLILEERWEEYRGKFRYPYPAIASRAIAPWMRHVVSLCVDLMLCGASTVLLLLSSQLIASVASKFGLSFCYWILILAVILCPFMWRGTPKEFWPAAVIALSTTAVASILIIISIANDSPKFVATPSTAPTVESFFLAFATILFGFGGVGSFPTFQNDMKDRSQFYKSAIIGFIVIGILYVPVAITGYKVYGNDVKDNIIQSLSNRDGAMVVTVEVLLAVHFFFAFLLIINAPLQEFEEILRIPNRFGWKRVTLRTSMMLFIVFIATSVPRFSKILDLVGGSVIPLTTFVFPPWFYMRLCSQTNPQWSYRPIPLYEKLFLLEIMIVGIVGGCVSTYAAMKNIISQETFLPPCYVNITAAESK